MKILLTGGMSYIGSHTAVALMQNGHEVFLYDNLSNSSDQVVNQLKSIVGKDIPFIRGDIRDLKLLISAFEKHEIDAVIHLAGLKSVGESVFNPIPYYQNNVCGTLSY